MTNKTKEQYDAEIADARARVIAMLGLIEVAPEIQLGFLQEAYQSVETNVDAILGDHILYHMLNSKTAYATKANPGWFPNLVKIWVENYKFISPLTAEGPDLQIQGLSSCDKIVFHLGMLATTFGDPLEFKKWAEKFLKSFEQYAKEVGYGLEPSQYQEFTKSMANFLVK